MTLLSPSVSSVPGVLQVGLVGRGILESRTPWLHEQEAKAAGLSLAYKLFDFTDHGWRDEDLPGLLAELTAAGYVGINVTYPFKQAVLTLLDGMSESAGRVGAVNTIAFADEQRTGYNTDITGFAAGFRAGFPRMAPGTVLQIGCGGAGAAVAHALLGQLGAERVILSDSDAARAAALHAQLSGHYGADRLELSQDPVASAARATGILNATPMGMAKFPGLPIDAAAIKPRHWVADIVYFPLETRLLAEARHKGCRTLDGAGMAVQQAADAFEIFTGHKADHARMRESFFAFVADRNGAAG
ncbi:MAG: shikimate dehydrogenase [Novosphingobium sp.]